MSKLNIYLRALEIGYDVGSDGISYNNLISKLTSEGYNTNKRITPDWYYLNFENPSRTRLKANPRYGYRDASDENFPLSYDSLMDYVDYL